MRGGLLLGSGKQLVEDPGIAFLIDKQDVAIFVSRRHGSVPVDLGRAFVHGCTICIDARYDGGSFQFFECANDSFARGGDVVLHGEFLVRDDEVIISQDIIKSILLGGDVEN
ncbi:hypothetical protein D3C80_18890 [compost metagenome]